MTTFLALYRGESVGAAKLLALTAEPTVIREFATHLLVEPEEREQDVVLQELEHGRRRALHRVSRASE